MTARSISFSVRGVLYSFPDMETQPKLYQVIGDIDAINK